MWFGVSPCLAVGHVYWTTNLLHQTCAQLCLLVVSYISFSATFNWPWTSWPELSLYSSWFGMGIYYLLINTKFRLMYLPKIMSDYTVISLMKSLLGVLIYDISLWILNQASKKWKETICVVSYWWRCIISCLLWDIKEPSAACRNCRKTRM